MGKSVSTHLGVRKLLFVALALALVFGWGTTAQAQTPAKAQYGNPTATAAGNPGASASASNGDAPAPDAPGGSGGSKGDARGGAVTSGVLPATGGPLLPLGALALGATSLLVLSRIIRR